MIDTRDDNGLAVAIVGATGAVGEAMLDVLEARQFPEKRLYLLASERSAGKRLQFRGKAHIVEKLDTFDFKQADIALFSAGGSISAEFAPRAAAASPTARSTRSRRSSSPPRCSPASVTVTTSIPVSSTMS